MLVCINTAVNSSLETHNSRAQCPNSTYDGKCKRSQPSSGFDFEKEYNLYLLFLFIHNGYILGVLNMKFYHN